MQVQLKRIDFFILNFNWCQHCERTKRKEASMGST